MEICEKHKSEFIKFYIQWNRSIMGMIWPRLGHLNSRKMMHFLKFFANFNHCLSLTPYFMLVIKFVPVEIKTYIRNCKSMQKKFFENFFFLTKTVQKSKINQNTKWETLNHICFFEIKTKMRSKYNNFDMIWFLPF